MHHKFTSIHLQALEHLVTTHCVIEEWGAYSILLPPEASSTREDALSPKSGEETRPLCDFTSDRFGGWFDLVK